MADGKDKRDDFYAVLGLSKECTTAELRSEYKKLAMEWHPDRCSASGNSNSVDEAKNKFQAIQQAYSVLSDSNKRFVYDIGVYDSKDDDDEKGMGDFLDEMASMMSQNKPDGNESFEELQQLFDEMFHSDVDACSYSHHSSTISSCSSSSQASCSETNSSNLSAEATKFEGFCMGTSEKSGKHQLGQSSRRKNTRVGRRR